jgi:hypothetical protein
VSASRQVAGIAAAAALALARPALAQTSASHKLTEWVLNTGGDPRDGTFASSSHYHVTLGSIGEPAVGAALSSPSHHADAGFLDAYPPPAEVTGFGIAADKSTWTWSPEKSVGSYDLYRDFIGTLPGGYGACLGSSITDDAWQDTATPPFGQGWFYLVTARNRLGEIGTKGYDSSGAERSNASPCP